ncbi:MAG: hypothetical protein NT015_15690 [Alphaproteobacteria bacterium]|nr:hypothetical protein [Alphaproteobacteria bacterium]
MIRELAAMAALLALCACASFSTDPEVANARVRQLCYVRDASWVQIQAPENAQAYREAWTLGAEGRAYVTPRWPEDEFWFRNASGQTKLCTGNPFYHEERCGAGTTVDFTEGADGIVASNYDEPVCLT